LPDNQPSYAGRPSVCRNCGALIGAGETVCQVCDAPMVAVTPATLPLHERYAMSYARAVLSRPYIFTIVFLVANLFVFMLMWESSGMSSSVLWTGFPEGVLLAFGAKTNYLIHHEHQYWRFVTPIFIHVNLPHVLINMYSLWVIGPWVEKLYGSAKFVVFWVATGIAGVVASYLTVVEGSHPGLIASFLIKRSDEPSAGASGALFGLVGVLFVFGIKYRHELPEGFKRAFGTGMLPIIMINLFIGYLGRGFIDNAAHLGGLASGAILALAVDYRRPGEKPVVATTWHALQVACIILVAASFLKTVQHFRDPLPSSLVQEVTPAVDAQSSKYVSFAKAMNDGQDAFYLTLKAHNIDHIDPAVKQLETTPSLDPKADEIRDGLKALLIRAKTATENTNAGTARSKQDEQNRLANDFSEWSKQYNGWLKTTGRSYGIIEVMETPSPN